MLDNIPKYKNHRRPIPLFDPIDKWQSHGDTAAVEDCQLKFHPLTNLIHHATSVRTRNTGTCPRGQRDYTKILRDIELGIIVQAGHFWRKTFRTIGRSLDEIDRSISSDSKIRSTVDHWRYLFGVWRPMLLGMHEDVQGALTRLDILSENHHITYTDHHRNLRQLLGTCETLQKRNVESFQAVMSTMSIMESKAAIEQGHSIQKLTELAFIFIPLSFAASFFGMEVKAGDCDSFV